MQCSNYKVTKPKRDRTNILYNLTIGVGLDSLEPGIIAIALGYRTTIEILQSVVFISPSHFHGVDT
jgi:hypothetical protein